VIVVPIEFLPQDCPACLDGVDILQSTGADDPVLHPAIRAFDLALGLRREGMNHFDSQHLHHAFPPHRSWGLQLGIGLVGL